MSAIGLYFPAGQGVQAEEPASANMPASQTSGAGVVVGLIVVTVLDTMVLDTSAMSPPLLILQSFEHKSRLFELPSSHSSLVPLFLMPSPQNSWGW